MTCVAAFVQGDRGADREITTFTKSGGAPRGTVSLTTDGKLLSDGSACVMTRGTARRTMLADLQAFADHITGLSTDQAIALGALRADLAANVPDHDSSGSWTR